MVRQSRILVIDDERDVRENLVRFLQLEGYRVLEAENGTVGIQTALRSPPDLVLCDLMMPGVDGFGVLARLRSEPATAAIPFVFLTASTEVRDQTTGYLLGASEYVTKPFSLPELGKVIADRLAAARTD